MFRSFFADPARLAAWIRRCLFRRKARKFRLRVDGLEERVVPANETFTVIQGTVLQIDTDSDGVIDPGETVTTTVTITNNSTNTDATGVQFTETLNGMTLVNQPGNDINVSPIAFDDYVQRRRQHGARSRQRHGETGPQSSVAGNVFANDVEFFGDTFTITAFDASTTRGGTVSMVTTGVDAARSPTLPAANFTGTDTFTYTITRRRASTASRGKAATTSRSVGTVTINVTSQGLVVRQTPPRRRHGTSTSPFDSLADVTARAARTTPATSSTSRPAAATTPAASRCSTEPDALGRRARRSSSAASRCSRPATDPIITNPAGDGVTLATGNTLHGLHRRRYGQHRHDRSAAPASARSTSAM